MTTTKNDELPRTLAYTPDGKTEHQWFTLKKVKVPDSNALNKKDYQTATARYDRLTKLASRKMTERELIAEGAAHSGLSVEEFIKRAILEKAKSALTTAQGSSRGRTTKDVDRNHSDAYKALKKEGVENITPTRLYVKAGTNFRSAERWLNKMGYAYESQADPDKKRAAAAAAPTRKTPARPARARTPVKKARR